MSVYVCPSVRPPVHASVSPSIHLSIYPHNHPSIQYRLGVCYGPGTTPSTSWGHSGGTFSWRPAIASCIVATLWQWSCWACALVTERGRLRAPVHQGLLWVCVGDSRTLSFQPSSVVSPLLFVTVQGLPLSFCVLFLSFLSLPVPFVLLGKVEKLSFLKHLWRRIAAACSQFTRQALYPVHALPSKHHPALWGLLLPLECDLLKGRDGMCPLSYLPRAAQVLTHSGC